MKRVLVIIFLVLLGMQFFGFLKFLSPSIRHSSDMLLNNQDYHISYGQDEEKRGVKFLLPLPPKTIFGFRLSLTAVSYISEFDYNEFINFYSINDYEVDGNTVYYDGHKFSIESNEIADENDWYGILIELIE